MDYITDKKSVSDKTRDIVAGTVEKAKDLTEKTVDIAGKVSHKAGEKWQDTEPLRKRAGERIEKAAQAVAGFGAEVKEGFKEGVAKARAPRPEGSASDSADMHI